MLQGSRLLPLTIAVDKFPVFRVTSLLKTAGIYTTDMVMQRIYSHLDVTIAAEQIKVSIIKHASFQGARTGAAVQNSSWKGHVKEAKLRRGSGSAEGSRRARSC